MHGKPVEKREREITRTPHAVSASASVVVWVLPLALACLAPPWADAARPYGARVAVDRERVRVMDGDTAEIRWSVADVETVRVLGIDTAELRDRWDPKRALSPRGAEARGFARGAFAVATGVELLRSARPDRYGRTLGYFFLDGRNYSVLILEARLAGETITRFGDNGLPVEAREVLAAAKRVRAAGGDRGRGSQR